MKRDYNDFGILKWNFITPSNSVDFLDLTIWIENDRILTRTYQKPNHPYLYIPPQSAHPPGCITGTIYSLIKKYYEQNSRYNDFKDMTQLLYKRHIARGWRPEILKPIFKSAIARVYQNPPINNSQTTTKHKQQFLHLTYHPNDISRHKIKEIYKQECDEILRKELGITRLTIAYNRPNNIQSIIAKAQLFQAEGKEVSRYLMGELD